MNAQPRLIRSCFVVMGLAATACAGPSLDDIGEIEQPSTDTSWKQLANESVPANWNDVNFDDSSWPVAVDEGAYGTTPWGTIAGMPSDTTAHWIWNYDSRNGNDQGRVSFRKAFVPSTHGVMRLTITADDFFDAWINGQPVVTGANNWTQVHTASWSVSNSKIAITVQVQNAGGPGGLLADLSFLFQDAGGGDSDAERGLARTQDQEPLRLP